LKPRFKVSKYLFMRKLVAFDLDGTVLKGNGVPAPGAVDALYEMVERGIAIASISGRNVDRSLYPFRAYPDICAAMFIGAYNGAFVISPMKDRGRDVLLEQRMPGEAFEELIEEITQERYNFLYYFLTPGKNGEVTEQIFSNMPSASTKALQMQTGATLTFDVTLLNRLIGGDLPRPPKLLILPGKEERDRVYEELKERYDGRLYIAKTSDDRVELMHPDVSKRIAVERIAETCKVPLRDVVAVGDGDNDLPMLTAVGVGVLMKNATQEVKDAVEGASVQLGPACDEGGFAEVVKKYLV
jgi:Cof subfamily protein (haloacid dehalogenase superfamily)